MLCVDGNIPILGATRDGNGSDKTLNNELLTGISGYMSKKGAQRAFANMQKVAKDNILLSGRCTSGGKKALQISSKLAVLPHFNHHRKGCQIQARTSSQGARAKS
jgi:hypothetical protein